jgi:flagellar biosynthetic protein FliR
MITLSMLQTDLLVYGLVLLRVTGFTFGAPFIGENFIPPRARIIGSIIFSFLLYPVLLETVPEMTWELFLWIAPMEFAIGIIFGMGMGLVFHAIRSAGDQVSHLIGLRFQGSPFVDPERMGVGEMLYVLSAFVVVGLGADKLMIRTFVDMYRTIPIGVFQMGVFPLLPILEFGSIFFITVIKLSLPFVGAMVFFYVMAGLFEHFYSQWDIFGMLFPGAVFVGLWALWAFAPHILSMAQTFFFDSITQVQEAF